MFQPGEDAAGRPPVGVLSYRFWQEKFLGDAGAVGKTYLLDGKPLTIVGVLTPAIEIGNLSAIDLWTPLALDAGAPRDRRTVRVMGRLAPGATLETADAELQPIAAAQRREHPQTNAGWQAHVWPTSAVLASGNTWTILGLLSVIVVFVLMIACANLGNLVLARLVARRHEQAVRLALGASRWQVVRPVFLESLLLSAAGGIAGLGLAHAGMRVMRAAATDMFLRTMVTIDGNVLIFTALLSLVTPLLFTLWPAWSAGRSVASDALHGVRASGARPIRRRRSVLIGSQVALAFSLLVVSALVVQSMAHLRRTDLGFDVASILTFTFDVPGDRYATPEAQLAFVRDVEARLAAVAGAQGAGMSSSVPSIDPESMRPLSGTLRDGLTQAEQPWANWFDVSVGFFQAAGIRVLAGRGFEVGDTVERQPVAILNALAAKRYFDDTGNAIGRTMTIHDARAWRPPGHDRRRRHRHARQPGQHQSAGLRADGAVADRVGHRVREVDRAGGAGTGRPGRDAGNRSVGGDLGDQDDDADRRGRDGQFADHQRAVRRLRRAGARVGRGGSLRRDLLFRGPAAPGVGDSTRARRLAARDRPDDRRRGAEDRARGHGGRVDSRGRPRARCRPRSSSASPRAIRRRSSVWRR